MSVILDPNEQWSCAQVETLKLWRSSDNQYFIGASQATSFLYPKHPKPQTVFANFSNKAKHASVMKPKSVDLVDALKMGPLTDVAYKLKVPGKSGQSIHVLTLEGARYLCEHPMAPGDTKNHKHFLGLLDSWKTQAPDLVPCVDSPDSVKDLDTRLENAKPAEKKRKSRAPSRYSAHVTQDIHDASKPIEVPYHFSGQDDPEIPDDDLPVAIAHAVPRDLFGSGAAIAPVHLASVIQFASTAFKSAEHTADKEREAREHERVSREHEREAREREREAYMKMLAAKDELLRDLVAKVTGK